MECCLLDDCSPKWTRLLTTLSLPRGVELAEKLVQETDVNDNKNVFHWPCFLKRLTSCKIVATQDHDMLERTHYASLPYNIRINLLSLLLRQHIMIGHRELERFVKVKDEATSYNYSWENNLLGRLQELVKPSPMNVEPVTTVHLSEEIIEQITNDWISKTDTLGMASASIVSWSSLKEAGSHKRSHDLSYISHEQPQLKKTKTGNDEEIASSVLSEKKGASNNDEMTNSLHHISENNVTQSDVNPTMDFSHIITKLKCLCNESASFDDKQTALLWEELASVETDQLTNCLKLIPTNGFKEQSVINMLYFIASMPVTIGDKIAECLSTMTVLPHLYSMHQPASRTFLAAFSHITKKQPNVCIQAIITPLLQQNQFGSSHSDLICTLIRTGDFGDHASSLWRVLVAISSKDCWNNHVILLAQALLDAKVELDQLLITETLQSLLHIAGYMTGNLRFGKLLLTMVSRHQISISEHLEDLERLVAMITPAFMQRSLQLAIKKLQ